VGLREALVPDTPRRQPGVVHFSHSVIIFTFSFSERKKMPVKEIVRILPSKIAVYPEMKSALCKKFGAFEVDPVLELEPLMIAPTLSREQESIVRMVSFGAPLTPSYIPPPHNKTGWKPAALWELTSLMLEEGPDIFNYANRIYVTDKSVALGGTRSFPVLILDAGITKLMLCSRPALTFANAKVLISKMAN
jgi:hypothetical protein